MYEGKINLISYISNGFIRINSKHYESWTDLELIPLFRSMIDIQLSLHGKKSIFLVLENAKRNISYFEYELPILHVEYSGALLQFFRCNLDVVTIIQ